MTDKPIAIIPAAAEGRIELHNPVTDERASVATKADEPVNIYYRKAVAPPPPPTTGKYGDGWPEVPSNAKDISLKGGGNNNIDFDVSVVAGKTFDAEMLRDYAIKLNDCEGTLFLIDCEIMGAVQGLAVSNDPDKGLHAPSICLIRTKIHDCYRLQDKTSKQPMAQVGVYYHDSIQRDDGEPTLGMYGCRLINCGIKGHDPATRARYARQFHHGVYCKGNAIIEAYDNLFVNYSGQGIKAIGRTADLRRNAFLMGAVGWNFGQDAGQQDKTGRWQMDCYARDNLVYGMGDLQADNQRLGWGCVLESCDATLAGNVFANPVGVGDKTPAIRCNRVRDYPVSVNLIGSTNTIVGHTHAFEVQGEGEQWGPTVGGPASFTLLDNAVSPFASRNGGTIDDARWDYEYAAIPSITLDVDYIESAARARTITAADVIADARRQIGGG